MIGRVFFRNIESPGHAIFAATMIGLGIMGLLEGDFAPIWDSVPKALPARAVLAYVCALVCLVCGAGLLWRAAAAGAARALLVYLLLWLLLIKGRVIFLAPTTEGSYQSSGETAVIAAAAWVLYAGFAAGAHGRRLGFVGSNGVRIATVLYGIALIAFGLSHFVYLELTAPIVPNWLPAHVFWAYFTGGTYLAAGVAIIFGVYARLAAALSALQIGLFTLLVWVPILASGHSSAEDYMEFIVSFTLTASAWVVADSYRATPWLAFTQR